MIRLYLIIGAVFMAMLGIVNWQKVRAEKRARVAETALELAHAEIEAERENTRRANEAAARFQKRADEVEADRRNDPLPAVRVRKCPTVLPQAATTPVIGEAAQADDPGTDAPDRDGNIGPELDDFATDAQMNLIQCEELIRWATE